MTLREEVEQLARAGGVPFLDDEGSAILGPVVIPGYDKVDQWFDPALKDLMPRRTRGDYRERTVNLLVRDAIPNPAGIPERKLFGEDDGAFSDDVLLADPLMRSKFGQLLSDHYVIETTRRSWFLFPFQSDLPGNYRFHGRYKLFNGVILAFFAKPGLTGPFNEDLLESFYGLFNDNEDLSLLDEHALRIARTVADNNEGEEGRLATAAHLLDGARRGEPTYREELSADPYFPEVHTLVQHDLSRALEMRSLGRTDRVNAVLTVFYLHLALYFWRTAYALEEEVQSFVRLMAGAPGAQEELSAAADRTLEGSPFRGQLRFRVAALRPRSVSRSDRAAEAFRDLNNHRLRLLPVNLALLSTARRLVGAKAPAGFADIAARLDGDPELKGAFDVACKAGALAVAQELEEQQREDIRAAASAREPGIVALRASILKRWRQDLRRSSTDITAGLMKRGGKGIFATRGSVQYFELGQDLLLLLTKLIAGDEAVRYRDFLDQLSLYGLAPQDREEEAVLAEVLRSLQLLEKYSDTGEAMYVRHFL